MITVVNYDMCYLFSYVPVCPCTRQHHPLPAVYSHSTFWLKKASEIGNTFFDHRFITSPPHKCLVIKKIHLSDPTIRFKVFPTNGPKFSNTLPEVSEIWSEVSGPKCLWSEMLHSWTGCLQTGCIMIIILSC